MNKKDIEARIEKCVDEGDYGLAIEAIKAYTVSTEGSGRDPTPLVSFASYIALSKGKGSTGVAYLLNSAIDVLYRPISGEIQGDKLK